MWGIMMFTCTDSEQLLNDINVTEDFGVEFILKKFFFSLLKLESEESWYNSFSINTHNYTTPEFIKVSFPCEHLATNIVSNLARVVSQFLRIRESEADVLLQQAWCKAVPNLRGMREDCTNWMEWLIHKARSSYDVQFDEHSGNNCIIPIEKHLKHTLQIYSHIMSTNEFEARNPTMSTLLLKL